MVLSIGIAIGLFLLIVFLCLPDPTLAGKIDDSAVGLEADIVRQALQSAKLRAGVAHTEFNMHRVIVNGPGRGRIWRAIVDFDGSVVTVTTYREEVTGLQSETKTVNLAYPDSFKELGKKLNEARICDLGL